MDKPLHGRVLSTALKTGLEEVSSLLLGISQSGVMGTVKERRVNGSHGSMMRVILGGSRMTIFKTGRGSLGRYGAGCDYMSD